MTSIAVRVEAAIRVASAMMRSMMMMIVAAMAISEVTMQMMQRQPSL